MAVAASVLEHAFGQGPHSPVRHLVVLVKVDLQKEVRQLFKAEVVDVPSDLERRFLLQHLSDLRNALHEAESLGSVE
eukprot:CAMPEP_0170487172 /NCGR_PEP_ID=MMETSP0208-20121228/6040_1 /TAXON_ID=197538 /ORGANISM="Strombidium inclinatum, Strain S3" /LENGTH=76 /DNA_ID=CAMNT_0010761369 /DNA_START=206 /DNA_END=436 /DNA_ORIENTATION=+